MAGRIAELEGLVLAAHEREDRVALITLYAEAGDLMTASGRIDAACFVWTQAYVLALEAGDRVAAARLHALLSAHGRER